MNTGQRSAWRRRWQRSRAMRVAVPLAVPVALALVLGIVIANSGGGTSTIQESALGTCATPSASASAAAGTTGNTGPTGNTGTTGTPSAAPCTTASAAATASTAATASPAATASAAATTPAVNPEAGVPDLALTNPVDPQGNAVNLNQTAAQAANSLNCSLTVPANPLSAQGLATPWVLGDGCSEGNPNESAFVEATILSPGGTIAVYNPLVITQGTTAAAAPAAPTIPAGSQVIIDTGFNGNTLVLQGNGAAQGRCIDAFGNSVVAQTAACNAPAFYQDANAQVARGTLKIAPLGTGTDGQTCQTTQSFSVIDQDPSDNVDSAYLLNGNGQTAQDTVANKNAMAGATTLANGSDDGLLDSFVDPALGCKPFSATNTTSANGTSGSQALNMLSARFLQQGTKALLPVNDPQLLVSNQFSIGKTNVYRMETDQPLLARNTNTAQNAATFCQDMVNMAPAVLQLDMAKELNFTTPVAAVGTNLATFMGNRLSMSFTNLNCQNFGLKDPVTVTLNGNQVATAVTYSTAQQKATVPAGAGAGAGGRGGRRGGGGPATRGGGYNRRVAGRRGHKQNAAGM